VTQVQESLNSPPHDGIYNEYSAAARQQKAWIQLNSEACKGAIITLVSSETGINYPRLADPEVTGYGASDDGRHSGQF